MAIVVKLGGSLITDKSRPSALRRDVLGRIVEEIAAALPRMKEGLILSHGSGSFGHVAAAAHRIQEGVSEESQLIGVAETQFQAHGLHRLVVEALCNAGVAAFSLAPSSFLVAEGGIPTAPSVEPLLLALELGLVPVIFGDVVMDRGRGASISSTEAVIGALEAPLRDAGRAMSLVLWAGATEGVLDRSGDTVRALHSANLDEVLASAQGAAGEDVTGGMRLRIESAWRLALCGVPSLILNGLRPGRLESALAGEAVPGTRVETPS